MAQQNEILLQIRAETDKATSEIKKLKLQIDKLSTSANKNNGSLKGQEKAIDSLKAKISSLTKTLGALALAYVSFAGAKAFISSMADIEDGFVGIAKTTGASNEQMQIFKDGLYDLTKEMSGISLTELQGIAEGAGQLGVATEDILLFTESIAKISVATNLTAEDASRDFAIIANVFGEPIDNIEKLGSAVNELSATTAGTVGQIIDSTKRMAGIGESFGLSADEVMAFSATMADAGVRTEIGATALGQIFQKMQTDVEKFAKYANMGMDDFSNLMRNDPVEATKLLFTEIGKLAEQGKSADALKDLGLQGAGTSQVMLALAGNVDNLTKNLETSKKAYEDGTSVELEYLKASDTINSKIKDVNNAFVRLSKELTVELTPALKDVLDGMVEFIDSIDSKAIGEFASDIVDSGKAVSDFVIENKVLIKTLLEVGVAVFALNKAQNVLFGILGASGLKLLKSQTGALSKLDTTIGILRKRVISFGATLLNLAKTNPVIAGVALALGAVLYAYNLYNDSVEQNKKLQEDSEKATKRSANTFLEYNKLLDDNGKIVLDSADAQQQYLYSVNDAIEANDKLIESLLSDGYEKNKKEIESLSLTNQTLRETALAVSEVTKEEIAVRKKLTDAVKEEAKGKKELNDKDKEFVEKARINADKRVSKESQTLSQLHTQNVSLYSDLEQLERELSGIRRKYSNERQSLLDDYSNKVNIAEQKIMTDKEKAQDVLRRMDVAYAKSQEAIKNGDNETAKKYLDEYSALSEQALDNDLAKHKNNITLKRKDIDAYAERERKILIDKQSLSDIELNKEVSAHNQKIDMKILEIENMKTQIELQKASLDILVQIAKASGDINFKADLTQFNDSVKKADAQIAKLSDQKRESTITLKAKTTDANRAFNEAQDNASRPATKELIGDNTDANSKIDETVKKANESIAVIKTDANLEPVESKISLTKDNIQNTDVKMNIGADTQSIEDKFVSLSAPIEKDIKITLSGKGTVDFLIGDLKKSVAIPLSIRFDGSINSAYVIKNQLSSPIYTLFGVTIDSFSVNNAYIVRDQLSQPIYTIQYIETRRLGGYMDGGSIQKYQDGGSIQKFADGGFPIRAGALGGYGGGDRIKALLEAGEFIQRKEAVSKYGVDFMYALNNLKIPKNVIAGISEGQNVKRFQVGGAVRRYNTGGSVDSSTSSNMQPINLNIGGETFVTLADEQVGEALKRLLIKTKGM